MSRQGAAGAALPLIACVSIGALAGWVWLWVAGAALFVAVLVLVDVGMLYVEERRDHRLHAPPPGPHARVVSGPSVADGEWLRVVAFADGRSVVQHLGPRGWQAGEPQAMRDHLAIDLAGVTRRVHR